MSDDIEVYLDQASEGNCYIESLIRCVVHLNKLPNGNVRDTIAAKLGEVILLEIDLAKMGAEKARSEILKAAAKEKDNVVRPIK